MVELGSVVVVVAGILDPGRVVGFVLASALPVVVSLVVDVQLAQTVVETKTKRYIKDPCSV